MARRTYDPEYHNTAPLEYLDLSLALGMTHDARTLILKAYCEVVKIALKRSEDALAQSPPYGLGAGRTANVHSDGTSICSGTSS